MKKGGVREVNSFISVNPGPNAARRTSLAKTDTRKPGLPSEVKRQSKILVKDVQPTSATGSTLAPKAPTLGKASNNNSSSKATETVSQSKKLEKPASVSRSNSITKSNTKITARAKPPNTTFAPEKRRPSKDDGFRQRLNVVMAKPKDSLARQNSVSSKPPSTDQPTKKPPDPATMPKPSTDAKDADDDFEYEYEDDFEDYESDFESYSEESQESSASTEDERQDNTTVATPPVEEERKMDSGSYDLMYQHQLHKQKKQLEVIKEALQRENSVVTQLPTEYTTPLEIHDTSKMIKAKGTVQSNLLLNFNTRCIKNFSSAKERHHQSEIAKRIAARGRKLLQMITLDVMNYTLFDMAPVPYEVFMRCYAHKNTVQVSTQTNEDNLSSEIQTEEITYDTRWTQHPVTITKDHLNSGSSILEIMSGVGRETNDTKCFEYIPEFKFQKLVNFMKSTGEELIALLEEETLGAELNAENQNKSGTEITECISYVKCHSFPFLAERPTQLVHYDVNNISRVITVHGRKEKNQDSYLCIWNIRHPSTPKIVLKSHSRVSCCCFTAKDSSFVVAGHDDGSICVWNLREEVPYCETLEFDNVRIPIRPPSYSTTTTREHVTHSSRVLSVEDVKFNEEIGSNDDFKSATLCSVEEENVIIIWNLMRNLTKTGSIEYTPWNKMKFFVNQTVNIAQKLPKINFLTTASKLLSECNVLAGTDAGIIILCNLYGKKCKTFKKNAETFTNKLSVTSVEVCPYNRQFFAVGYSNGDINLFNSQYTEPMSIMENHDLFFDGVNSLQWLWNKLDYVLVLDYNSTFSVYRLHPEFCSLIRRVKANNVLSVEVSPFAQYSSYNTLHLILITGNEIQIHKLKSFDVTRSQES